MLFIPVLSIPVLCPSVRILIWFYACRFEDKDKAILLLLYDIGPAKCLFLSKRSGIIRMITLGNAWLAAAWMVDFSQQDAAALFKE